MKKSLIIRWAIILVITLSWCWSMFPVKDKDFLGEFNKLANINQEQLEQQAKIAAEKLGNIEKRIAALPKKSGKGYDNLVKDREKLNTAYNGYSAEEALKNWAELCRRIDLLMNGKDLDGSPLPAGVRYSGYKAVETAARGNNADLRSIRLSAFVKVPHQPKANNKTVLRYIRRKSAGKLRLGLDLQGGTEFVVSFNKSDIPDNTTAEQVRDQILEIMRNRLDKSGVTEPELRGITATDISIRMPSIDEGDKTGIRNTIKDAAKLEFYMVAANNSELVQQYNSNPDFRNPPNVIRKEMLEERNGEEVTEVLFLDKTPAAVRGVDVKNAFPTSDEYGQWSIAMSFNDRGARDFGDVTAANVGRRMAIVLDDTVYSAPVIQGDITGGNASITGSFTLEDARRLAGVISSGNLPVSIDITSEFGTAPTLGTDSIKSGALAGIFGLIVVILFMLWYYHFCGLVADIALLVNTVLVLGTMALTGATITMPGIAGMVLTIGMTVDANVLIFERIREELNNGKNLATSVSAGYHRAFSAIFDSNLTTLITCFFLYKYGSGTVMGFAVSLAFGVMASMFTALFMTHAIFDLAIYFNWFKKITMREFKCLKDPKIDFFKYMKPALGLSAALVLLGLAGFFARLNSVMAIDFAGGTQLSYTCDGDAPDVAQIRDYLAGQGYENVNVGYKRGQSGNPELEVVLPKLMEDANVFSDKLDKAFPECKMVQGIIYQVGPSVGAKFRRDSVVAAVLSFIAIVIYLAFRFEFTYGVAAVIAVIHDVIVSAGLFIVFFHGQISLTVVAALMTIIGYSLNDTIVIFDRVRELRALRPDDNYRSLVNDAINHTLSRTMLTTLTTLFVIASLLILGGGVIRDFALVMFFGLIAGTYSTIFIATAWAAHWHKPSARELENNRRAAKAAAAVK